MKKTLLEEDKIAATIRQIPSRSFTVLDFSAVFKTLYPADWRRLVARFGQLGEKRRYTVTTYLSNRLDVYSQKPGSLLQPLTHYSQAKFNGRRRTSKEGFIRSWLRVDQLMRDQSRAHADIHGGQCLHRKEHVR
jgi:hypothetical protein